MAGELQPLTQTLFQAQRQEMDTLQQTVHRILTCGETIPLTLPIFEKARALESSFSFGYQDALILASVLSHLEAADALEKKCFVSRNSKDFNDRAIVQDLHTWNCRYIATFDAALEWVNNEILSQS